MTRITNCEPSAVKAAAKSLKDGNLVAFPTETVYGLGADACNEKAVGRIYESKGRPANHPLIVHVSSVNNLYKWAKNVPEYASRLASAFWPGPMTLVLQRTDLAKDFITGGQDNVGIRVPAHAVALTLIKEFEALGGCGVVAPSANRFGAVSPTTADDVSIELSKKLTDIDLIINGGQSMIGIESTIIDCTQKFPIILRPGAVTQPMIHKFLDIENEFQDISFAQQKRVSGSLNSHYSPKSRIFLKGQPRLGDGFIALANVQTPKGAIRLASPKNNLEYAQILFQAMRLADFHNLERLYIVPPIGNDIAVAINDRLTRSAFRDKA